MGPLAAGTALYALYLVLVIILGRTGRTEYSFPATAVAVAVNVALNLLLVPDHGIIGAGVALLVSYAVVVALMHAITRRLFYVPVRVGAASRLAVGLAAGLIAVGELAVPQDGLDALALTFVLCAAYPVGLYALRFLSAEERERLPVLLERVPARLGSDRDLDTIEQAQRDRTAAGSEAPRRRYFTTRISFLLTNSSIPYRPSSRPKPERLTPPKGSSAPSSPTPLT